MYTVINKQDLNNTKQTKKRQKTENQKKKSVCKIHLKHVQIMAGCFVYYNIMNYFLNYKPRKIFFSSCYLRSEDKKPVNNIRYQMDGYTICFYIIEQKKNKSRNSKNYIMSGKVIF